MSAVCAAYVATGGRSAYNRFLYLFMSNEFETTETELKAIATAATAGLSRKPVSGYSRPAATGMLTVL